jgi:glycosyltransferase involved in cell wall biosynthesis
MNYDPHPLFDTRYYLDRYPDVAAAGTNPLAHYLKFPGCNPHPLFDSAYYLQKNPEAAAAGINPLIHYLTRGAFEGRDPSPAFSSRFYLEAYPDVATSGINPLVHYVQYGIQEGRKPHPDSGAHHHPTPAPTSALVLAPPRSVVLMIDACYPRPDRDSGSLDQISFVRIFQALDYEVYFAADIELGVETHYRDHLATIGVRCVTYPDYLSVEDFLERHGAAITVCFLSRVHFGARHIDTVRRLCPDARIIFNTVDLHHVREQREAELKQDAEALGRAAETRIMELAHAANADATIVVSDQEAELLRREVPQAHIFMVPLIREYAVTRAAPFATRSGIGFIGSFQHMPNVDAVTHFLNDIWPLVWRSLAQAEFFVIGSDLPSDLAERRDDGVTFIGYVPKLEPWLDRLKMTVAPLRYGAGAKGKIVTSLAHGVPCVASPIAAEGMGLEDGREILVGRTHQQFADRIVALYNDERRWTQLSDAGMSLIQSRYSIDHGIGLMRGVLDTVGAPARR